jgi:hypothetical protein
MKLGLKSWLMVTIMAVLGIVALKVVLNKYPIKGATELVNAV